MDEEHRARAPGSAAHGSRFTSGEGQLFPPADTWRCLWRTRWLRQKSDVRRRGRHGGVDLNTSRAPNVSKCYCHNKLHPPTLHQNDGCVSSNVDNRREYSQHTGRTKTKGTSWRPQCQEHHRQEDHTEGQARSRAGKGHLALLKCEKMQRGLQ